MLSLRIGNNNSTSPLKKQLRRCLVEPLEERRLLTLSHGLDDTPDISLSRALGDTANYVTETQNLVFHSKDADAVSLSDGDSAHMFFDHGPQKVDLLKTSKTDRVNLDVSGSAIFSAWPRIEEDRLHFRLSGVPGVQGSATVRLIDILSGMETQRFEITLTNEFSAGHEVLDEPDQDELWSVLAEGEYGGGNGLVLDDFDPTAEEPHVIFCDPVDEVGSIEITGGPFMGDVRLQLGGTATHGDDYYLSDGSGGSQSLAPDSSGIVTFDASQYSAPFKIYVHAKADDDETEDDETVTFAWASPVPSGFSGNATVTITDEAEAASLYSNPSEAYELAEQYPTISDDNGLFHLVPSGGSSFCNDTTVVWRIDVSSETSASLADVVLIDDDNTSALTFGPDPNDPDFLISNVRTIPNFDDDFQLRVFARNDGELEGDEELKVSALVEDIDFETSFSTVTIKEDYLDAQTEKDEEQPGCSCTCTTCIDGNAISIDPASASASVATAHGYVVVSTEDQNGQFPVVYVGLELPSGKAIPTGIAAQLQVVEKWEDDQGQLVGLGRQLAEVVSQTISFEIPAGLTAGSTIWFAMQADLTNQVESWTRGSTEGPSNSSNGIGTKIVPLEILANATFAPSVTDKDLKYSGWVGHVSHVMRDQTASSLAPGVGRNISIAGIDRMIRNTEVIKPDVPTGGGSTGGKVTWESGSMLVRASGGVSWFVGSSGLAPESQDELNGSVLTDRSGNKKTFSADGDLTEFEDAAGNTTTFDYATSGADQGRLTQITDERGRATTFTPFTDGQGHSGVTITSINTLGTDISRSLVWRPITVDGGRLEVKYEDPDENGPRQARVDIFNYNNAGFLTSIQSGEEGNPSHETVITHDVGYVSQNPGEWLVPSNGSRRLASILYPDQSRTTIDLARQTNSLLDSFSFGSVLVGDPRALRVGPTNQLPNYVALTYNRVGSSDPQRTIMQLDHRGRTTRSWDPEQVDQMGLTDVTLGSAQFATLQANTAKSYEYTLEPTSRDDFGEVIGADYGEVISFTTPIQENGGSRQTTSWTYTNENPVTQQRPIQNQETFQWNDDFDIVTLAVDETGNTFHQNLDTSTGLVTQQRWEEQGSPPFWQNQSNPLDVSGDSFVTPIDALMVQNYLNQTGGGAVPNSPPPPPYYDVNGDNFVTTIDALIVISYLNNGGSPPPLGPSSSSVIAQIDYSYSSGSLPKGLVTQQTIATGRTSGDQVIDYAYYNNPADTRTHGKIWKVTETAGGIQAVTEFTYDDRGNLETITDPEDRVTKLWHDQRDRLIAYMSPDPDLGGPLLPTMVRYDYDVFDRVVATELINSAMVNGSLEVTALVTGFEYDQGNRLTARVDQNPDSTRILAISTVGGLESRASGNAPIADVPTTDDALVERGDHGLWTQISYFATTNEVHITESDAGSNGRTTKYTYDLLDRVTKIVEPDPGLGTSYLTGNNFESGFVTQLEYDNLSNVTKITDALNNSTQMSYDLLNRLTSIAEPLSTDSTFAYTANPMGWEVAVTNELSETTSIQLDSLGRHREINGDTPSQTLEYWLDGNVKSVVDELDRKTEYSYDERGRLVALTEPNANTGAAQSTTQYSYFDDSLLQSVTDPLNRVVSYAYDSGGRLQQVTEPDPDGAGGQTSAFTLYERDSLGNITSMSDAIGPPSTYEYDSLFRRVKAVDPELGETLTSYDIFGNITSITDASDNVTEYTYNNLDRLIEENQKGPSQSDAIRSYSYDGAGNLRSLEDRNGRTTTWNYDSLYRLTQESWDQVPKYNYTYDNVGRLLSVADSNSDGVDFEFQYDARGQLLLESQSNALLAEDVIFARQYDAFGNRIELEANFGGALVGSTVVGGVWDFLNTYDYDGMNRLETITQTNRSGSGVNSVAPKLVDFGYNAASQLTDVERFSATTPLASDLEAHSRYAYDLAGRLESITHAKTAIPVGSAWNGTSTLPSGVAASDLLSAYEFDYDTANRITSIASYQDGFSTAFGYDDRDQLTSATYNGISGLTTPFLPTAEEYGFDATGNRNTSGSETDANSHNELKADGLYDYTYDDEGNVTSATLAFGQSNPPTTEQGIDKGYDIGDLTLFGDLWNGSNNDGEFGIVGTEFIAEGQTYSVGDLRWGVAAGDFLTGTGYIMYSATNVHQRLSPKPHGQNAEQFIAVRYSGGQWQFNNNHNTAWYPFSPVASDRLVAEVNFSTDTATSLQINDDFLRVGYDGGDLSFAGDEWNGNYNNGEFGITGTEFIVDGESFPVGNLRWGVAAGDYLTGTGYIMYSAEDVHDRFSPVPHYYNADHFLAVRYSGGQWQFNNNHNTAWYAFDPVSTDRLVASVDFSLNTAKSLVGIDGLNKTYEWDHRNRLTSVVESDPASGATLLTVDYGYDAFDQRVSKRVDENGDAASDRDEVFVWADGQEVLRFQDSDGQSENEEFRITNRYLWSNSVDMLLADEQYTSGTGFEVGGSAGTIVGDTLWALTDHLGSVRDVIDNNGVIRQHVIYDSFGRRIAEQDYDSNGNAIDSTDSDAIDVLFGYTGRDWDEDTELQYNRARWYDPTQGRWLSQDPIGFAAGDANLYRYVANRPTNAVDPSGLVDEFPVAKPENGTPPIPGYLAPGVRDANEKERAAAANGGKMVFLPPLMPYAPTDTSGAHFSYPVDGKGNCWRSNVEPGEYPPGKGAPPPVFNPGNGGTVLTIVANKGHVYLIVETPDGHQHSYGAYGGTGHIGSVMVDHDLKFPAHSVTFISYRLDAAEEKALAEYINKPWQYINQIVRVGRRVCIDYAEDGMNKVLKTNRRIVDGEYGWPQATTVSGVINEIEKRKEARRKVIGRRGSPHPSPTPKRPGVAGGGTSPF